MSWKTNGDEGVKKMSPAYFGQGLLAKKLWSLSLNDKCLHQRFVVVSTGNKKLSCRRESARTSCH